MKPTKRKVNAVPKPPKEPGVVAPSKITCDPASVPGIAGRVNQFVQDEWPHADGQIYLTINVSTWYQGTMYIVCLEVYEFDIHHDAWPFRLSILKRSGPQNRTSDSVLQADNHNGHNIFVAESVSVRLCHLDAYDVDGILTATIDRHLQP